ncbi:MAG: GIY-YIG nuclease family protein, partial [Rikenellaceae bacterium]
MQIKEKISLLPTSAGVYQFLDAHQTVIYVGKAKNLRSRVGSYFVESRDHSPKVRALVRNIAELRHIVVDSEYDALLLENNLIKELQPRYNILLKDSKSYPWICISREPFPRIFSTRRIDKREGDYFGPYASISMQNAVLELIRGLYPLRSCRLNLSPEIIKKGRYSVCLEYHIGNCKGCCIDQESPEDYAKYIASAREILRGDLTAAKEFFGEQMQRMAGELKFEEAEKIKAKLISLEKYSARSIIVSPTLTNIDVVNILIEDGVYCNRMRVVSGAVVNSYTFELRNT